MNAKTTMTAKRDCKGAFAVFASFGLIVMIP